MARLSKAHERFQKLQQRQTPFGNQQDPEVLTSWKGVETRSVSVIMYYYRGVHKNIFVTLASLAPHRTSSAAII